jgi:hypothetical protein
VTHGAALLYISRLRAKTPLIGKVRHCVTVDKPAERFPLHRRKPFRVTRPLVWRSLRFATFSIQQPTTTLRRTGGTNRTYYRMLSRMGPLSRDIAGHMCRMSRVSRYQKFVFGPKAATERSGFPAP